MNKKVILIGLLLAALLVGPVMAIAVNPDAYGTTPVDTVTSSTSEMKVSHMKTMTGDFSSSGYAENAETSCDLALLQAGLPQTGQFQVTFNYGLPPNQPYFFQDYIFGTGTSLDTGSYGSSGATPYNGWCMNAVQTIYPVNQFGSYYTYTAGICSSTDTACIAAHNCYDAGCTLKYINYPENLPKINYILNNYYVGKTSSCGGTYTFGDIQYAMWKLVFGTVPSNELWALGSGWTDCKVNEIYNDANANGGSFVPKCGDKIAIVFFPYGPTSAPQAVIAQAVVGELITSCCQPLSVEKTAEASYTKQVEWKLSKDVNDPDLSGVPGTVFPDTIWTVFADKTETFSGYKVTGDIKITNPNPVPLGFSVSDTLSDNTVATVTCPGPTVPASGSQTCSYIANPSDAAATKNTATVTADGKIFEGFKDFTWTEILDGVDSGMLSDGRFDYSESISSDKTKTFTETFSCPTDKSMYDANGIYTTTVTNIAVLDGQIGLNDDATVGLTCEASFVDLQKWTDGVVNPAQSWTFNLYNGPDGFGGTAIATGNTLGDPDGILEFGNKVFDPTKTYTVCELNVPAGWTTVWMVDGTIVNPYNPNADDPVPQDLGNRCLDFGAGTSNPSIPIPVGTLHFSVDNQHPGGAPRTPGYWKNWNRCTGGGQAANADRNGNWPAGFWLLDDVITKYGGIPVDGYIVDSCANGVAILDDRQVTKNPPLPPCPGSSTKKVSSNAGNTLAKHLLATKLNLGAGACNPSGDIYFQNGEGMTLNELVIAADGLLAQYTYNGCESGITKKSTEYATALAMAKALDQYNNGMFCP